MKQSTKKSAVRMNTYYTILAKQSKKALEVTDQSKTEGALVQLAEPDGSENQQWKAVRGISAGYVKLVNRNSGLVLDIIKAGTQDGSWVHQWVDVDAKSQSWAVEANEDGSVKISSNLSGKCLDVVGMSQRDGANVQIWTDTRGDNQRWLMVPIKKETEKAPAKKSSGKKASSVAKAAEKTQPAKVEEPSAKEPAAPRVKKERAPQAQSSVRASKTEKTK